MPIADYVAEAVRELGPRVIEDALIGYTDAEIEAEVHRLHPGEIGGQTPSKTVSRVLQEHASESPAYLGDEDLYYRTGPNRWAMWEWLEDRPRDDRHFEDEAELDDKLGQEGHAELRRHWIRERRTILIRGFKDRLHPPITCRTCDFDFGVFYGEFAEGFIEAHHTIPIADGEQTTRPEDLVELCSNCHRMVHRWAIQHGELLTWQQLREIVQQRRRLQGGEG